jgi:hypothetical protein
MPSTARPCHITQHKLATCLRVTYLHVAPSDSSEIPAAMRTLGKKAPGLKMSSGYVRLCYRAAHLRQTTVFRSSNGWHGPAL